MIFLSLILALNLACVEKKSNENETNKPEWAMTLKSDSLQFFSGIRAIFQDSKGNYWLGSHKEGLSLYDGKTFEYFTISQGLADNQIRSIQEDKKGRIWIGTAKGVSVYDNGKFTHYSTNINQPKYDWSKTNGELWFNAGEEDGINRFDGINMHYLIFPKPNNTTADNSYGVTDIAESKDGKVWIATYAALFNYDGKQVNIYDAERLNLKRDELLHIRSV